MTLLITHAEIDQMPDKRHTYLLRTFGPIIIVAKRDDGSTLEQELARARFVRNVEREHQ